MCVCVCMCIRATFRCVVNQFLPSLRRTVTFFLFSSVPIQEGPTGECISDGQASVICELGNPLKSKERVRTLKTLSCPNAKQRHMLHLTREFACLYSRLMPSLLANRWNCGSFSRPETSTRTLARSTRYCSCIRTFPTQRLDVPETCFIPFFIWD